ncbi:MAG: hypothetical protein IH609_14500 [Dehalococcoidia bacterium]|nr:hypothetical protein [Dehalococcoidia bacterium]
MTALVKFSLLFVLAAPLAVACGDDGERGDWTGDAAVDATIRGILDGDRDRFRDSLEAVERECNPAGATDVGELPCPEGTTGATVRVFQVTGCHAEYRAAEQFDDVAEAFFGAGGAANGWKLYASYRARTKSSARRTGSCSAMATETGGQRGYGPRGRWCSLNPVAARRRPQRSSRA